MIIVLGPFQHDLSPRCLRFAAGLPVFRVEHNPERTLTGVDFRASGTAGSSGLESVDWVG
jgi:hypothetical protein